MRVDLIDISKFNWKHFTFLLLPRFALIFSAIAVLFAFSNYFMAVFSYVFRSYLRFAGPLTNFMDRTTGLLIHFDDPKRDFYSSAFEDVFGDLTMWLLLFAIPLILICVYLACRLYFKAFNSFSFSSLLVSFLFACPVVLVIQNDSIFGVHKTGVRDVLLSQPLQYAATLYIASLIYFLLFQNMVMSDKVSQLLRNARSGYILARVHRFGLLEVRSLLKNAGKSILRLLFPLIILFVVMALNALVRRVIQYDDFAAGFFWLIQIALFIVILFWLRPYLANRIFEAGRRFRADSARSASQLFEHDKRPPVLFLRSFGDDAIEIQRRRTFDEVIYGLKKRRIRLEELLVEIAFRYGPVGALHNPHVHIAQLGAARDLSSDEDWQGYILRRLHESRYVVFVVGETEGLYWEISKAEELQLLHKFIFVFPPNWEQKHIHPKILELLSARMTMPIDGIKNPVVLFERSPDEAVVVTSHDRSSASYESAFRYAIESGTTRILAAPAPNLNAASATI